MREIDRQKEREKETSADRKMIADDKDYSR